MLAKERLTVGQGSKKSRPNIIRTRSISVMVAIIRVGGILALVFETVYFTSWVKNGQHYRDYAKQVLGINVVATI